MAETRVATIGTYFFEAFSKFIPNLKAIDAYEEVSEYDMIILTGGEDVSPMMYGQKNTYSFEPNKRRDALESNAIREAMDNNVKIFGVCRGLQVLNVCLGGSLFQDIRIQRGAYHDGTHSLDYCWGDSTTNFDSTNSSMKKFFPNKVNSLHHQGIENLGYYGKSKIIATYLEIPEIVSYRKPSGKEFALAVQFHPEWMPNTAPFFNWLINDWVNN